MREITTARRVVYDGRVVRLEVHDVRLADGRPAVREIVRHAPAVAVLPRLPDGRVLLVRQYRKAVDARMVELCAGLREPDEPPEVAARRELREETGCEALELRHLGRVFVSPGYTDEWIDLFYAECDEPAAERMDPDEDERIEAVPMTRAELAAAIADNRIQDGKTIAAWCLCRARGWLDAD